MIHQQGMDRRSQGARSTSGRHDATPDHLRHIFSILHFVPSRKHKSRVLFMARLRDGTPNQKRALDRHVLPRGSLSEKARMNGKGTPVRRPPGGVPADMFCDADLKRCVRPEWINRRKSGFRETAVDAGVLFFRSDRLINAHPADDLSVFDGQGTISVAAVDADDHCAAFRQGEDGFDPRDRNGRPVAGLRLIIDGAGQAVELDLERRELIALVRLILLYTNIPLTASVRYFSAAPMLASCCSDSASIFLLSFSSVSVIIVMGSTSSVWSWFRSFYFTGC